MGLTDFKLADKILNITGIIGAKFSESQKYNIRDYCEYKNEICRFITPKPSGAWDDSAVVKVKVMDEIKEYQTNIIYPIGSIYTSTVDTEPSLLFGGVWEKINGKFLFGTGTYAVGDTGGEETHKLTTNEIPSHTHSYNYGGTGNMSSGSSGFTASNLYGGYTGSAGGNVAHNNMPPYLVVHMWQRTA